jgi:hypothetical protein
LVKALKGGHIGLKSRSDDGCFMQCFARKLHVNLATEQTKEGIMGK